MGWVKTVVGEDMVCLENKAKSVSCRIESRKVGSMWVIYKSYFNAQGLNFTEEYVAPTYDKMSQIILALQKEKKPTLTQIRQRILEKNKRLSVQIEREFKEYGVEKWKFGINGAAHINFAIVRCADEIDVDFVICEIYSAHEDVIIKEIIDMLGFDGLEDVLNINVYYFSKYTVKQLKGPDQPENATDLF